MNQRHCTATRFIERAIAEHQRAPFTHRTTAAIQMAIELSYAQGDIDDSEHLAYTRQCHRLTGIEPTARYA